MNDSVLLLTVRLLDGRYHGIPEWPPSPFRLFQALMAGALTGAPRGRADELAAAFGWLEGLGPPSIAAPPARFGRRSTLWVPNNDLDAVGGEPKRIAEIRTAKRIEPRLIDPDAPFIYIWRLPEGVPEHAATILGLAEQLFQLGRGIDMAHATAEVVTGADAEARLAAHHAVIHRPAQQGVQGEPLRCPGAGSFASLRRRHCAQRARLQGGHLTQAPPADFHVVAYDAQPARLLFDLMAGEGAPRFAPLPLTRAAWLATEVRDRLASLLARSFYRPLVEQVVIGRGAVAADKAARLRIIPLPSIGFIHADRGIRRVLIEVPPDCPIPAREIAWVAGSVHLGANQDGEILDETLPQLVRATDERMSTHYGIGAPNDRRSSGARVWRTVTPAVLPAHRPRGRISGGRRAANEAEAAQAVRQALRHAGTSGEVATIRVQREPFDRRGERADAFALPERFGSRGLHHVEITFAEVVPGPLIFGDGRYLGLGLMAPLGGSWRDVVILDLEAQVSVADGPALLRATRRALMALARDHRGRVPQLFSGHESDGAPARSGRHEHVFLAADDADRDGLIDRLVVAAPWACDRAMQPGPNDREQFDRIASSLQEVRAGQLGVIQLSTAEAPTNGDPLVGPSLLWESRTLYRSTRHAGRRKDPATAVVRDIVEECRRRGLPRPEVDLRELTALPNGGGIGGHARLRFAVTVTGPILIGRDSHSGGGLFVAES